MAWHGVESVPELEGATFGPLDQWLNLPGPVSTVLGHRLGRSGGLLLPLFCLLPTVGAILRGLRGPEKLGRRLCQAAAVASAATLASGAGYHACRAGGQGALGSLSCSMWRELDVVLLICSMTFVAAALVGLSIGVLSGVVTMIVPARAAYMTTFSNEPYSSVVRLLLYSIGIVVGNCLLDRWYGPGWWGSISFVSALGPELRDAPHPYRSIVLPWVLAIVCFSLPLLGNLYHWPSIWACHLFLGVALFNVSFQSVQNSARRKEAAEGNPQSGGKKKEAAVDNTQTRDAATILAPPGKPKQISSWSRKKLRSQLMATVGSGLPDGVSFKGLKVNGECTVKPAEADKKGVFGSADVAWSPEYKLDVEIELTVEYGEKKMPTAGHCNFTLRHKSDLPSLPMDVDLNVPSGWAGHVVSPADSVSYAAARQVVTRGAMSIRTQCQNIVPLLEQGMLQRVMDDRK